jgi:hypothetical protein
LIDVNVLEECGMSIFRDKVGKLVCIKVKEGWNQGCKSASERSDALKRATFLVPSKIAAIISYIFLSHFELPMAVVRHLNSLKKFPS